MLQKNNLQQLSNNFLSQYQTQKDNVLYQKGKRSLSVLQIDGKDGAVP